MQLLWGVSLENTVCQKKTSGSGDGGHFETLGSIMNTQVDDGLMLKTTFHKITAQCYRVLIVLLLLFCYIILVARVGFSGRVGVRLRLVGGSESF